MKQVIKKNVARWDHNVGW